MPSVLLPLPVLPIRPEDMIKGRGRLNRRERQGKGAVKADPPIFSRGLISKEMPWMTAGSSGLYLITRSSTWIKVLDDVEGQYAGGRLPSTIAGGS